MVTTLVSGCGSSETPAQKLDGFKAAHKAIYDAWAATTEDELRQTLSKGMVDPFLGEQMSQQSAVMKQRIAQNERHGIREIKYNQLDLVDESSKGFTVYADWTVHGFREHGDVHEMKVSYRKKFHLVKVDGVWKIDKMFE
jgi:hypothetical protein